MTVAGGSGMATGAVTAMPRLILRLEGAGLFVLATLVFTRTGSSWWLYFALFLLPDVSFAGYLAGPRVGAAIYNAAHSTVGPVLLAVIGMGGFVFAVDLPLVIAVASIWAAHIGFDRVLGYGLKYPSAFADTHLGRLGRAREGRR